jgi:SNF family Na+-dependent transporter
LQPLISSEGTFVANGQKSGGEQWATRIGVIMAVSGSAVGIGNYLRFPGLAAKYGGGAFMLPYFVSLLLLGIPLAWAEWTMGRYGGSRGFKSAPGIYSVIWRHGAAKYCGALALLIPLVVYMYYVLIEAWCLSYAINYITGDLMSGAGGRVDHLLAEVQARGGATPLEAKVQAYGQFYQGLTGKAADGAALAGGNLPWIIVLVIVFALNFSCIYRGLNKGIEMLCNIGMPVLFVLSFIVLFRVLTLGTPDPGKPGQSVLNGLGHMWNPQDLSALANPETWLAAAGQIFFTLGVGFGIIINYASYVRPKDDIALSSLSACAVNEFSEVCHGGLITIPAAFIFLGAAMGTLIGSSFDLGFVAMPNVFDAMWGGRLIGFFWFFMLFIAAIASSVSMLQPCLAFLEEGLGMKRPASAAALAVVAVAGSGLVLYFSKGLSTLDAYDFWVGNVGLYLLALFQTFLYGWIFGIGRGHRELHQGAHLRVPYFMQYVLKYVTPAYLLAIFAAFCWYKLGENIKNVRSNPTVVASLAFVGVVFVVILLLTKLAGDRWERLGLLGARDDARSAPTGRNKP